MTYQEFKDTVCCIVRLSLPDDAHLTTSTIIKNNDVRLDGLSIQRENYNLSPTLYLNHYYARYLDGENITNLADEMISVYNQNSPDASVDVSFFTEYHNVQDKIIYNLVSLEKNETLLSDIPHLIYLDFAIVFYCLLASEDGTNASILIHNQHLTYWNVATADLYEASIRNTPRLMPSMAKNISELLQESFLGDELFSEPDESMPMVILTNKQKYFGAGVLLYKNVLDEIASRFSSNLMILPSSIHEVILVPIENDCDMQQFNEMVCEVNRTQLAAEDVLSDHAYFYDYKEKKIKIA